MSASASGFERVRQVRVHEQVALQLRQRILEGDYQPGDRLPHERELIEEFGVSRHGVRQAMQLLEQQGLVDVRVGSGGGCFVAPRALEPVRRSFANLFALRGIEIQEFLAAKSKIEPTIFGAAALTITAEQLDELRDNMAACHRALGAGDDDLLYRLAHDFHRIVSRATDNVILELVLAALIDVANHIPNFRGSPSGGWDDVLADHEEILDGLARGDEEHVQEVACRHAASVEAAFRASLERDDEAGTISDDETSPL